VAAVTLHAHRAAAVNKNMNSSTDSLEHGDILEVPNQPDIHAPPPRRRGLSKLRRRLSQTFRLSLNGSISDFATFTIDENGEMEKNGKNIFQIFIIANSRF